MFNKNNDVIGIINLISKEANAFNERDKELINLLVPQAEMAMSAVEQIDTFQTLYNVSLLLTSSFGLQNVLNDITLNLKDIINADVVVLYLYDKEQDRFLEPPIWSGKIYDEEILKSKLNKDDHILREISGREKPHFADYAEDDSIMNRKFVEREQIKSSVGFALRVEKDLMGILFVNFREKHHFSLKDKKFIEMFASLSSVAINRVQLHKKKLWEEKLSDMGKFSAEMAHQIGNPLGIIKSTVENLLDKKEYTEDARLNRKLEKVLGSVSRANLIKDRILKPLSTCKKLEKVNIKRVIYESIRLLEDEGKLTQDFTLQLDINHLPELILCFSDIREVFLSLIRNSINAMPDGGILNIKAHFSNEKQNIGIIINDNGVGIPDDKVDMIFIPFETNTVGGTGLGLSMSYEIIKSYDGDINVQSKEGKGTTFTITLPLNEKTAGSEALGFIAKFFKQVVGFRPKTINLKETKSLFDEALDKALVPVNQAVKKIEEALENDFEKARSIFFRNGEEVSIVEGKMLIGKDYVVNDNVDIVDEIKDQLSGASVTIFQVIGGQAVRISTTVLGKDGKRAFNTVVSRPVYEKTVKERSPFVGHAKVLEEWMMTRYEPIYNNENEIIGLLYMGVPDNDSQIIDKLKKSVSKIKFGNNGYVFIIYDNEDGSVLYHPDFLHDVDFMDFEFYKSEISNKRSWMDAEYECDRGINREIIHYHEFQKWLICAACPKDEVLSVLKGE